MNSNNELAVRLALIVLDESLSVRHVGIYVALLHLWSRSQMADSFQITRRQVMKLAKVSNISCYHKCIKDLVAFGYLNYEPSYDPYSGSSIEIV